MALSSEEKNFINNFGSEITNTEIRKLFKEKFGYHVSEPSVIKYRSRETKSRGGCTHGISKESFTGLYEKYYGDVQAMFPETGYKTIGTVVRRCWALTLEPKNIPKHHYSKRTKITLCDKFVWKG